MRGRQRHWVYTCSATSGEVSGTLVRIICAGSRVVSDQPQSCCWVVGKRRHSQFKLTVTWRVLWAWWKATCRRSVQGTDQRVR